MLHIADATERAIQAQGLRRVGLRGTVFTLEQDFYKGRLCANYGLEVLVPDAPDRQIVHRIIYDELCLGQINAPSKLEYLRITEALQQQGAEVVILGCTEIGLLLSQADTALPLFDTTALHAQAALE
ncbi:MAG: amino acid racemase [Motiliproteus sp.]